MNNLCLLTNLSSSEAAAWSQAAVSVLTIVVGVCSIRWQNGKIMHQRNQQDALQIDGRAHLIVWLKHCAINARLEKRELERLPLGSPLEPNIAFVEIADALNRISLDTISDELSLEVLLSVRRSLRVIAPLVNINSEIDVNKDSQDAFDKEMEVLDAYVIELREEAKRLMLGKRRRHIRSMSASSVQ